MSEIAVNHVRPELFTNKWILHHDNVPSHSGLSIKGFLVKKSIMILEHPTYLPDLALCDCFPFPTMKNHLKGSHFETMEEIQKV
jgi:hypothetical protein